MGFQATPYTVTTALMVAFALFVIYVRMKNWLDSNVPLFFYVILIIYMRSVGGLVPLWLIMAGFGLTMLLRFEFMNQGFARVVAFFTTGTLCLIIYVYLTEVFGDGQAPF